jgi:hypothetical protein
MADIRCSHCGKDNPDFFDVCQFCQSPLKSESMLHAGDVPSEKDTDELEPILPEWLQDARQQSKDSVEDDTFIPENKPRIQNADPIDLLAELASQDDSEDEDEVPDWLASINPVEDKKSPLVPASGEKEDSTDFFAQFSQTESQPSTPLVDESGHDDTFLVAGNMESQGSDQPDELTDWLSQTHAESSEPLPIDPGESDAEDNSWMHNLGATESSKPESSAEQEPEDLTWLHNLEAASKQTGELSSAQADTGFDFSAEQPEASREDLSWLNNIGGAPVPDAEGPASSEPKSSQEDLSWLNNLGGTPATDAEVPAPSKSESSQEDLSWLNNLGGTPATDADVRAPSEPKSSQDDLGWLNNLGGTPAPATGESTQPQSESSKDDLSWLNNLGSTTEPADEEPTSIPTESSQDDDLSWMRNLGEEKSSESSESPTVQYTPAGTAPLTENAGRDSTPDWLKSAMEEPSMPAPGNLSMEWFAEHEKSTESEATPEKQEMSDFQTDETSASIQDEPASVKQNLDLPSGDSFTASSQDVDEMFNIDIPDWVSQETDGMETTPSESVNFPASGDENLAPVELPSWVQAMRPVDSSISETGFDDQEREAESEGPLAGFHGVIPSAPIGSSLRPKAFSMKLQVTDEQQAGASLIEQIIASETTVHPTKPTAVVASQRMLRWSLAALFIVVLGIVIGSGSQSFDIVAPGEVSQLSNLVGTIPDGSPVLMVVDYEPAVAGELAAAAGPVLDQLALSRHTTFTFLSMSPNGSALVDHLMLSTKISRPAPDGMGYQAGVQYFNTGFLPGGSAGVLGFIDDPVKIMPNALLLANVDSFSNFEAVVLMTDNADSGRIWMEQLELAKQSRPEIASKPLIVVSSAQAGPMLEPYVSSEQVDVLISGLSDAAKYEYVNQSRPGIARAYWDSFGVGLIIAVMSIVLGGIWSIFTGIREQRTDADKA